MSTTRLVKMFEELVTIDSVSGNEAEIHDFLKKKFLSFGLDVNEDESMWTTGLGANNMIATLKGNNERKPLLFSAHTDTVTPGNGVQMIEENGILYSKGETILGADDKAGIAIMLEAIQRIKEEEIDTGDLEFVLSPGEEIGLIGSSALDMESIKADMGYVLDSGGSVGRVTIASPTLFMYEVSIIGKAAHAGLEPEKGISAVAILSDALKDIRIGRIDERTTANIGVIQGGEATNIVMDSLLVKGEVRAIDPAQADTLITEMIGAFETSASLHGGTVAIDIKKMATGFDVSDDEEVMQVLLAAGEELGYDIIRETSGGGSDANVFNANGKRVVNLSVGYEKIHTTEEYIPVEEMEKAVLLVIELAKHSPRRIEVQ
ncbi:M20/M25/M40 family metallo-hydrolase [Candidatus Enterococcus clewellii]|uniref:Peptidase T-like protein n=1 Tax=Candidatus Enterococcus clewellii TaxID=1834193 RepID=A0A242K3A9_9ENTE|nr:M20/M25/M40 family metallo-hydrolase [Enterococcus sp. 9E7_DIV0242]OTP13489.1 peptidase T-like protein [Enterococcus sp. 9E7_DIV0242]